MPKININPTQVYDHPPHHVGRARNEMISDDVALVWHTGMRKRPEARLSVLFSAGRGITQPIPCIFSLIYTKPWSYSEIKSLPLLHCLAAVTAGGGGDGGGGGGAEGAGGAVAGHREGLRARRLRTGK